MSLKVPVDSPYACELYPLGLLGKVAHTSFELFLLLISLPRQGRQCTHTCNIYPSQVGRVSKYQIKMHIDNIIESIPKVCKQIYRLNYSENRSSKKTCIFHLQRHYEQLTDVIDRASTKFAKKLLCTECLKIVNEMWPQVQDIVTRKTVTFFNDNCTTSKKCNLYSNTQPTRSSSDN